MIPRLGDGNDTLRYESSENFSRLENDSPSRGRKQAIFVIQITSIFNINRLENDSPSRGRKHCEHEITIIRSTEFTFRK